jgi:hypothetical protein
MKSQIKRQNGGNCGAGSCPLQLGGHKQSRSNKRQFGRGCGCAGDGLAKLQLGGKSKKNKKTKSKKSKSKSRK